MSSDDTNDATTTNGGGGTQPGGSEEAKESHTAQGETQAHDPQSRIADTIARSTIFVGLLANFFTFCTDSHFALNCRTNRRGPLLVLQRAQCAAVLCTIASVWHA
jgi:hypothetical protein